MYRFFLYLHKYFLPCFTASTIVTKLSSVNIISDVFFATSVPFFSHSYSYICIFLVLEHRLLRSPVIATYFTSSSKCFYLFLLLCSGETSCKYRIIHYVLFANSHLIFYPILNLLLSISFPFNIPKSLAIKLLLY